MVEIRSWLEYFRNKAPVTNLSDMVEGFILGFFIALVGAGVFFARWSKGYSCPDGQICVINNTGLDLHVEANEYKGAKNGKK